MTNATLRHPLFYLDQLARLELFYDEAEEKKPCRPKQRHWRVHFTHGARRTGYDVFVAR